MKLLQEILCGIVLAGIPTGFDHRIDKIRETLLPAAIRAQEEKIGVKHGKTPLLCGFVGEPLGKYDAENNIIFLSGNLFLTEQDDELLVNRILYHELGHLYADQTNESLGKGNWPPAHAATTTNNAELIAHDIIGEGIGMYFETRMTGIPVDFKDEEFPKTIDGFFTKDAGIVTNHLSVRMIYDAGYHLVKPVLDKDCAKGVAYLITHLPAEQELVNLPAYREKVLKALAEKKE